MARLRLRLTPLAAALTLAGALHPALAADVKFTPRVELRETYTDNVHLATIGLEQPDVVTELKPGFALELNGRRLKGHADYTLDYLRYRDRKTDKDKLHSFFGEVGLEAVDDWLFVEAKGNVGQVLIDPFGTYAIGENAINLSANRAEIRSYSVTPYVRHDIGDFARGEVRYAHESVSSDADRMSNTQTDRKTLVLSSGPAFHNVGWGLLLNDETIDFASVGKVGITTALGVLKYNVSRQFALTSTLGHEKYGYLAVDNRSSGAFWTVGFGWRPSVRTLLDFSVGHRFYGTTASLNFNHSSRRTAWQVSYNEDITTTQQQFAVGARNTTLNTAAFIDRLWTTLIPDVNARQAAVLAFIRESGLPATLTAGANSFANTLWLCTTLKRVHVDARSASARQEITQPGIALSHRITKDAKPPPFQLRALRSPILRTSSSAASRSSHKQGRAMAYLDYGLSQGEGFIVITGEVGAGKTTLVRNLFRKLPNRTSSPVHIVNTHLDSDDTCAWWPASACRTNVASKTDLLTRLEELPAARSTARASAPCWSSTRRRT
jgi:uncharacterized protein (PEP-CTERM system associated)